MATDSSHEITERLKAWAGGDEEVLPELVELVYRELHKIAKSRMRHENPGHTLQTTALANEAWIRLVEGKAVDWQGRSHFYAIASLAMRRILVDYARHRHAGSSEAVQKVALEEAAELSQKRAPELAALDEALTELEKLDSRKYRVVELKFLAGLEMEEIAEVMEISSRTVKREWKLAKAILYQLMNNNPYQQASIDKQ